MYAQDYSDKQNDMKTMLLEGQKWLQQPLIV